MLKKGDWVTVVSGRDTMRRISIGVIAAIFPHVLRLRVAIDRDWQPDPRQYSEVFYIESITLLPGARWDAAERFRVDYEPVVQDIFHQRWAEDQAVRDFRAQWRAEHPEPELPDPMSYFQEA